MTWGHWFLIWLIGVLWVVLFMATCTGPRDDDGDNDD